MLFSKQSSLSNSTLGSGIKFWHQTLMSKQQKFDVLHWIFSDKNIRQKLLHNLCIFLQGFRYPNKHAYRRKIHRSINLLYKFINRVGLAIYSFFCASSFFCFWMIQTTEFLLLRIKFAKNYLMTEQISLATKIVQKYFCNGALMDS